MGRLIDADLLKKNCKCTGTFESNFQCISLKTLGDVIDEQPTAYDPDKVAEQLEDYSNADEAERIGTIPVIELDDAIKIVKGGGVDA